MGCSLVNVKTIHRKWDSLLNSQLNVWSLENTPCLYQYLLQPGLSYPKPGVFHLMTLRHFKSSYDWLPIINILFLRFYWLK